MSLSTIARAVLRQSKVKVSPVFVQKALFGNYEKFNLPPIPVDGIYRRPPVPDWTGPIPAEIDDYYFDDQAPERVFDSNGDQTNPYDALRQLIGFLTLIVGGIYIVPSFIMGKENHPRLLAAADPFPLHNTSNITIKDQKYYTTF